MNDSITQKELKRQIDYNENTGVFRWKASKKGVGYAGKIAGYKNKRGYCTIIINATPYKSHRLAWLYIYGEFPKHYIDHINQNPSDNRICNLRDVLLSENQKNRRLSRKNTSGALGICWREISKKWEASIKVNKKNYYLGKFKTIQEAIKVRKKAEKEYGFHSNHGSIIKVKI